MTPSLPDPSPDAAAVVDFLAAVFQRWGDAAYLGEAVTQAQHMLQAAHHAGQAGASEAEIAAALLHDIGHFLAADVGPEDTVDHHHEALGATWLGRYFPPAVVEPVRRHVTAKRYLCAVEADYFSTLSAASVHSLGLQGGPMEADEVAAFEALPWHASCVRVRRWDEMAKDPDVAVPGFAHYRPLLKRLARG